ncbi:MAG: hypothetical protein R2823_03440 [Acidimicrobiia bacterium]
MAEVTRITGGADPAIAAAIAAVVNAIERQEQEAAAVRPRPIRQSQWVQAGRPLERRAPMTSAEYDRLPGHSDMDELDSAGFV